MWTHWVARSNAPFEPFRESEICRWAWGALTGAFPERLSVVLMPNHLHLVLPKLPSRLGSTIRNDVRVRLTRVLSGVSRRLERSGVWQPIPEPTAVPDRVHLRRVVRYVALNPCRKQLCRDPMEWAWSTYRELLGATVGDGDLPKRLATELGESGTPLSLDLFVRRFHTYVSSDASVVALGSRFPAAARSRVEADFPLSAILAASAAALRVSPVRVKQRGTLRPLFVHLASNQGWRRPSQLAAWCGIGRSGVHRILQQPCPPGLAAAQLCLGDERLRSITPHSESNTPRPEMNQRSTKASFGRPNSA